MKTQDRIKKIVDAARAADPNAQLMTLEQMAAMMDATMEIYIGGLTQALQSLKNELENAATELPETQDEETAEPCPYGERATRIRELAEIFSLSHTSIRRIIQSTELPYDRTPGGVYLLNVEEVWAFFQEKYRMPGRAVRVNRNFTEQQLRDIHTANPGRILWNTKDLARALGVDISSISKWRKSGLAYYAFSDESEGSQRAYRYDLQDVIYFLAGTTKEAVENTQQSLF